MKKYSLIIFCAILSTSACSNQELTSSSFSYDSQSSHSYGENAINLLSDTSFANGFRLLEPRDDGKRIEAKILDYDGAAKGDYKWEMSQWASPFNFKDADFSITDNGTYLYKNINRSVEVDTKNNAITLNLDSYAEYMERYGHSRTGSENWSHLLLEQNFENPANIAAIKYAYAHLEFTINKSENKDPTQPIPCAQLTWYFTITDVRNGDSRYQSGNDDNDYMWFGLSIYDSRYPYLSESSHVDTGFNGATNRLIYGMDSRNYLPENLVIGKEYVIDINILPFIKNAYLFGIQNGALQDSNLGDLCINYMNIGWELPGSYDVSLTLKNMSVYTEEK